MKKNFLLSTLTGITMWLAFPPFKFGFLAYVTLIPFYHLLEDKSFSESFRWGYFTGLLSSIGTLYWINWVTLPGGIATIVVLPLYFSIYSLIHHLLHKQLGANALFLSPFVWTTVEFIKSLGEIGFPWTSLAYTQTYYPTLIQYASITSVYGVSFWIVTINVLLFRMFRCRNNRKTAASYALIIVLLFLLPWTYGRIVMKSKGPKRGFVKLALVQGNIDPLLKWDSALKEYNFATYERLTEQAAAFSPDLMIWPETATPCYLRYDRDYLNRVKAQIDSLQVPLLTGTPDYLFANDGSFNTYNSAFLLRPHTPVIKSYAKIQLVPFGERVPYQDSFPFKYIIKLLDKLELGQGNWSRGEETVLFSLPLQVTFAERRPAETDSHEGEVERDVRFSVPICYESVFPDLVRKFVVQGADFLVVITNDAWFGRPSLPEMFSGGMFQHSQIAIFRAIENRIEIARCANTGVSEFIDSYGRVRKPTGIFEEAVIVDSIGLRTKTTFYTRHGNIFSVAISAVVIITILSALCKKHLSKLL